MRPRFTSAARLLGLLTLVALNPALPPKPAHAQDPAAEDARHFPAKPIRIIVPFTPGGGNDLMGRYIGAKLTARLGQPTVIDNRPGANGIIGAEMAARSPADGYSLLIVSTSFVMNAALLKLPYDPVKSFTPVSIIGSGPNILAVTPTLPVKSTRELVALAKAKPGRLHYASSGIGGFNHFSGELFNLASGADIVHVPYKGGTPAMTDVMVGYVEVLFNALISALPHVRSGKLRALGVGSLQRTPVLPEVPAIAEAVPGYEAVLWWGILAPAGLPAGITRKLNAEIGAILSDAETVKYFARDAAEPIVAPPEAFGKVVVDDIAKWTKVAKASGIKAQ